MRAIGVMVFVVFAAAQFIAACVGIEHHLGGIWAFAAVVVAFLFRFTLPITIGAFFGARDVWHWQWALALVFAAPGLLVAVPALLAATIDWLRGVGGGLSKRDTVTVAGPDVRLSPVSRAPSTESGGTEAVYRLPESHSKPVGWTRVGLIVGFSLAAVAVVVVAHLRERDQWGRDPYPYSSAPVSRSVQPSEKASEPVTDMAVVPPEAASATEEPVELAVPANLWVMPPVELGVLVDRLMIESGAEPSWAVLADGAGPVIWLTDGVEDDPMSGGAQRYGVARVTVDGKVTTVLHQTLQEVPWDVVLRSDSPARFGPQHVLIAPQNDCFGSTGSGCDFEVVSSLRSAGLTVQQMCERFADGSGTVVYAVLGSDRRSAWVALESTAGSGGASSWLKLFWRIADIDDDVRACMANRLPADGNELTEGAAGAFGTGIAPESQPAPDALAKQAPADGVEVSGTAADSELTAEPDGPVEPVGR